MTLRYFNFIPVYNNPKTVLEMAKKALNSSSNLLFIIDDGSSTPIADLFKDDVFIKEALSSGRLFIERFSENKGKGAALKRAISWGVENNFTHVITVDADGQLNPEEIPKFQEASEKRPWNYILGERYFDETVPKSSVFGRSISNTMIWLESGHKLTDTQTGFRCYPLFWVQNVSSFRNRFDFELELIVKGLWLGAGAQTVPVSVIYPKNRVTHFNKLKDNFLLTLLHIQLCILRVFQIILSPLTKKNWSGKQTKSSQLGIKIFTIVLKFLGVRATHFLLLFVCFFYYLFIHKTRSSLKEYWRIIEPDIGFLKLNINTYLSILHFGRTLVDQYYTVVNKDHQQRIINNFSGIVINEQVLISGHIGHPKVAAYLFPKLFKKDLATIEYVDKGSSYDKNTFGNIDKKIGVSNKPDAIFSIYQKKRDNEVIAALIDRPTGARYELVRFHSKLIPIDIGIGIAAKTVNSDVSFFAISKASFDHYKFKKHVPETKLDPRNPETHFLWAKEFVYFMEEFLKDHPYTWSNFYPLWKTSPEQARPKALRKNQKTKTKTIPHFLSGSKAGSIKETLSSSIPPK